MNREIKIEDINIRTELRPGDIGFVIHLHGDLYRKEYKYGIEFETYVAEGLVEFYNRYDPNKDRLWICEHNNRIIGFMLLMHRNKTAQLRYFLLQKEYRGIGLGNKLMELFITFLLQCGYDSAYLWTTKELDAAAHLYLKYGFRLTEEKESDAFGKRVVEQKYELTV